MVDGVDLHHPFDDATAQLVRDALHEHSVLFFHDQDLTEDEQLAFAATFGPVGQYPLTKMFGGTAMSSTIEDTADSPPDADGWHTDVTWVAEPPAYAVLNAKVIPERGGDTIWSSLFAAYDALSPVMQDLCCRLTVRHHSGADFHERVSRTMSQDVAERIMAEFPPVEHPLVRTHPVTGRRALFVSGRFMDKIVGMRRDESDALLGFLGRHVEDPNFCVRWHWTDGRRRGVGRGEHQPPRALGSLPRAPRHAAVHGRRRTSLLPGRRRELMDHKVIGTTMPVLEMQLEAGESIVAQGGELSWMTGPIQLETAASGKAGAKGMFGAVKRAVAGGSLFMTEYTAQGGAGMVAFATKVPGQILPIEVSAEKSYMVHRGGYLCGLPGVNLEIGFQQKFSAGSVRRRRVHPAEGVG